MPRATSTFRSSSANEASRTDGGAVVSAPACKLQSPRSTSVIEVQLTIPIQLTSLLTIVLSHLHPLLSSLQSTTLVALVLKKWLQDSELILLLDLELVSNCIFSPTRTFCFLFRRCSDTFLQTSCLSSLQQQPPFSLSMEDQVKPLVLNVHSSTALPRSPLLEIFAPSPPSGETSSQPINAVNSSTLDILFKRSTRFWLQHQVIQLET